MSRIGQAVEKGIIANETLAACVLHGPDLPLPSQDRYQPRPSQTGHTLVVHEALAKLIVMENEVPEFNKKTLGKTFKQDAVHEYTPNVIEPSFGLGRILYTLLEHSYRSRAQDVESRVLSLPPVVAPTKVLIVPLSAKEELIHWCRKFRYSDSELFELVSQGGVTFSAPSAPADGGSANSSYDFNFLEAAF
ncbi:hypothetical protein EV360DRAFT_72870 [Lentinula raphanica]|nr:hypothetical protein EV360DRAFT_72870 [Lentinula raphanica]